MLKGKGKVIALGSLAVVLLGGTVYGTVIPHIPSLCQTVNNCTRESKFKGVYRQAVQTADSALEQGASYENLLELEQGRDGLSGAIDQLATIPEDTTIYLQAKEALEQYGPQFQELDQRWQREKQAETNFTEAQKLGDSASEQLAVARTIGNYKLAKTNLEQAQAKLKQIPTESLIAPQVTPLQEEYQSKIKAIESKVAQILANLIDINWANQDYWSSKMPEKSVVLTFDDGPIPPYTDKVLDLLKKHNAKATFFVIGRNVDNFCPLLQRVAKEGHEIANHTYTHPALPRRSAQSQLAEMEKAQKAIVNCVGEKHLPFWFRSPFGEQNSTTLKMAHSLGLNTALWTIDTKDWQYRNNADIVAAKALKSQGQDIILFHDFGSAGLDRILVGLKKRNLKFLTLSEAIINDQ